MFAVRNVVLYECCFNLALFAYTINKVSRRQEKVA